MNLLSEIISKPVLNLYTGKIEGTVKDICFDSLYKKILNLKIFDEEEEEYLVNTNKIYSIGENTIVVKNSEAITPTINVANCIENNPMNMKVFSVSGDYCGKLSDMEINDKYEIISLITNEGNKIERKNIVNIASNIIYNNTNKKVCIANFKPKLKLQTIPKTNVITILPRIEDDKNLLTTTEEENKPEKKEPFRVYNQPTPQRLIGNGNFLIGRKALKTIYGINNEIIIKKDNIINAKNIQSAIKHSKLVELTVFSKIKAN